MDDERLMPATRSERIEVRRLMAWFNDKFFEEVSNPLVTERIYKRFMSEENGGGAPAADVIRAAKTNVRYHLAYIGWLAQTRNFLAGDRLTYADLAAAAHLSAIDYLGDVPWSEDDAAKTWYARVKSRPSFRPLLSEWLAGVPASRDLRGSRLLSTRKNRAKLSPADFEARARARGTGARLRLHRRHRARTRSGERGKASSKIPRRRRAWRHGLARRQSRAPRATRACCGPTCAPSSCSASITGPTKIRWRCWRSATAARSRSMRRATIITT